MNETFLYVADALAGDDDASLYKASNFLSLEIASATTVILRFKAGVHKAAVDTVTLTVAGGTGTLANGAGTNTFRQIAKEISGLINGAKGNMVVLGDDVNSKYASPLWNGVVTAFADA